MIQITISEKDNPKVAGWLMDNGIEYSSVPIQEGKSKDDIKRLAQEYCDNPKNKIKSTQGFSENDYEIRLRHFIAGCKAITESYKTQSPVPVSGLPETFKEFLVKKLSHLKQYYDSNSDYLEHLISREVKISIPDVLQFVHEYETKPSVIYKPNKIDSLIELSDMQEYWKPIIDKLKQNFKGSTDYLSGVNDGMYEIINHIATPTEQQEQSDSIIILK